VNPVASLEQKVTGVFFQRKEAGRVAGTLVEGDEKEKEGLWDGSIYSCLS